MSIEYHGWIALATSHEDWDDGNFGDAFDRVRRSLSTLSEESGHSANMMEHTLPRTVHMSGYEVESSDNAVGLLTSVSQIFDKAYGELAIFDLSDDSWFPSRVKRIVLIDGQIRDL